MTLPVVTQGSAPPDCTLYVGGVRYADGSTGYDLDPVALSGLSVTWGRSTVLDQPGPATASFAVLDSTMSNEFRDQLFVGQTVDILATAIIYPDPTVSIVDDPGFEGPGPVAARVTGGLVNRASTGRPAGAPGASSLRVDPLTGSQSVTVTLPPRAFTTDPVGWDSVPATLPGQSWTVGLDVHLADWLGAGAGTVYVEAVAFDHPNGARVTSLAPRDPVTGAGWHSWSTTIQPPAGVWLGVRVTIAPAAPPAWQAVPAGVTWTSLGDRPTWLDLGAVWLDTLTILAPAAGAARTGAVFSGRITDLTARWDRSYGGALVDVIAQDVLAELGSRMVGATAWPAESLGARGGRIVTGAGQPRAALTVDAGVASYAVSYRDAGLDDAAALLAELATSCGGALWCTTSTAGETALRVEDVGGRPGMLRLQADAAGIVRIVIDAAGAGPDAITLDACDPLLDPVEWHQDSTDVATTVTVTWLAQVPPTDVDSRDVTITDAAATARIGQWAVSVSTILADESTATTLASIILARLSVHGWRVAGLTLQMTPAELLDAAGLDRIMRILDGTTRPGLPIYLVDLPAWSPIAGPELALYLDGGRFTYELGAWTLELLTIDATAIGTGPVWNDLPGTGSPDPWLWNEFDPAIDWDDLAGVRV